MKKEKKITFALFIIYLVVLTWIILFKMQFSFSQLDHFRSINLIPFAGSVVTNGKFDLGEMINNFIVFIPVGLYLGMLKPQLGLIKKICPVIAISFFYETLQFIFAIGASDITDIITNTLGGVIGILLVLLISKVLKEKTNRILNIIAIICTAFVLVFLALLLGLNNMF